MQRILSKLFTYDIEKIKQDFKRIDMFKIGSLKFCCLFWEQRALCSPRAVQDHFQED